MSRPVKTRGWDNRFASYRKWATVPRILRLLALLAVVLAGGFVVASVGLAWRLTGPTRRPVGDVPSQLTFPTESVRFLAKDGRRLCGWFIPNAKTKHGVILLHGHGGNRRQMVARAQFLRESGYSVLLYDARGQGLSEGDKVSAGWYETADLLGAIDFLRSKGMDHIGCIGASQGGATIALTGGRLPAAVKWVVLEETYPTMRDALDRRFRNQCGLPGSIAGVLFVPLAEWRLQVAVDDIAPIRHMRELPCPVFVIGGENDRETMPGSTRALFDAASRPKELWIVPGAGHVDIYGFAHEEYRRRILEFIDRSEADR